MSQYPRRILEIVLIATVMFGFAIAQPTKVSAIPLSTSPLVGCIHGDILTPAYYTATAGQQFTFTGYNSTGAIFIKLYVAGSSFFKSGVNSVTISVTTPAAGVVYISSWFLAGFGSHTYVIDVDGACEASTPAVNFNDGRLNNMDTGETAALYCTTDGNLEVYVYGTPKWKLLFTVTPEEIARVPQYPDNNTLIKQRQNVRLYRLETGELQLNAPVPETGKADYVFQFTDCAQP